MTEKIITLKDVKDSLKDVPDEFLDKFYYGLGEGAEETIELVTEEGDGDDEGFPEIVDTLNEKYPQINELDKFIKNVGKAQRILDATDKESEKLEERLWENGEQLTSTFFDEDEKSSPIQNASIKNHSQLGIAVELGRDSERKKRSASRLKVAPETVPIGSFQSDNKHDHSQGERARTNYVGDMASNEVSLGASEVKSNKRTIGNPDVNHSFQTKPDSSAESSEPTDSDDKGSTPSSPFKQQLDKTGDVLNQRCEKCGVNIDVPETALKLCEECFSQLCKCGHKRAMHVDNDGCCIYEFSLNHKTKRGEFCDCVNFRHKNNQKDVGENERV